jgi:hypothetical protein
LDKAVDAMLNKEQALGKLSSARDYEEKIAQDLNSFYLSSLQEIADLSRSEKNEVELVLKTIIRESWEHNTLFTHMIEQVLESGKSII